MKPPAGMTYKNWEYAEIGGVQPLSTFLDELEAEGVSLDRGSVVCVGLEGDWTRVYWAPQEPEQSIVPVDAIEDEVLLKGLMARHQRRRREPPAL